MKRLRDYGSNLNFVLLAAIIVVGLLYRAALTEDPENRLVTANYYPAMAEGWLKGGLDLAITPPAGLLALSDPYDYVANTPFRTAGLHDLSLYRGKLYMYWGPSPALTAFVPWRLITGRPLSTANAIWLFCWGAYGSMALIICLAARTCFPDTPPTIVFFVLLGVGICSFLFPLLRRPAVWEVPISAAICFGCFSWFCSLYSLHLGRLRVRWIILASFSYGLAVAARPNWIFGALTLLLPMWSFRSQWRSYRFWRDAALAVTPLALCLGLVLLLNWLRFDSPFEFGTRYRLGLDAKLSGLKNTEVHLFDLSNFLFNFHRYLFSVPRLLNGFPFLRSAALSNAPTALLGSEEVWGLFIILPLLLTFTFHFLGSKSQPHHRIIVTLGIGFGALFLLICTFSGSCTRYESEIAVPLALLGGVGVLHLESFISKASVTLRLTHWCLAASLVYCCTVVLFICFQHLSMMRVHNNSAYVKVGRFFNAMTVPLGWARHNYLKSVTFNIQFPTKGNDHEVLLMTEGMNNVQAIMLEYPDEHSVQFVIDRFQESYTFNKLIIDRNIAHQMEIELGSFAPPLGPIGWKDHSPSEIHDMQERVQILIDGRPVLDVRLPAQGPILLNPSLGKATETWSAGEPFSGVISDITMIPFVPR